MAPAGGVVAPARTVTSDDANHAIISDDLRPVVSDDAASTAEVGRYP
eukprot:COSAG01_NODE_39634_length_474_cov_0.482667_1_plen_46_part_10